MIRLEIAGLIVQVNISIKLLHENMYNFLYKGSRESDIYWEVRFDDKYQIDESPCIINKNLKIYEKNDIVVYEYTNKPNVPFMIVSKDNYSNCSFYVPRQYENTEKYTKSTENYIKLCLFNSFREMFLLRCAYTNRLPVHSAAVSYDERAYMFAAPSGVGKSTHASLWQEEFGCEIINGDIVIIEAQKDDKILILHGCPWCGTSNIFENKSIELGAIAFLEKSDFNRVYQLDKEDIGMRLLENHFIPFINKETAVNTIDSINLVANMVKGFLVKCCKDSEAAVIARDSMVGRRM